MKAKDSIRSGITLPEVVMSTIMVGVVLVAALDTVGAALRTSRSSVTRSEARRLAEELLEEVLALPYADPQGDAVLGIEAGETDPAENRLGFDDIDDYLGWSAIPPQAPNGAAMTEHPGWKRLVRVKYVQVEPELDGGLLDLNNDTGLKRIAVEVIDDTGKSTILRALRSEYGIHEIPPATDSEWVSTVTIGARVGNGERVTRSHSITNRATGP